MNVSLLAAVSFEGGSSRDRSLRCPRCPPGAHEDSRVGNAAGGSWRRLGEKGGASAAENLGSSTSQARFCMSAHDKGDVRRGFARLTC